MKSLNLSGRKEDVFFQIENYLVEIGLKNYSKDDSRPWGGFFVVSETDTKLFLKLFYSEMLSEMDINGKMSPKILIVEKQKRLSWQYHHRRSELWKLISGQASIVRGNSDAQANPTMLVLNEIVTLSCGERHRLIGGMDWGVVAEIWKHTDINNPSDEDDIVRLQDDFGRGTVL